MKKAGWLLSAAFCATSSAFAAGHSLVVAEFTAPAAGWAMETDDAEILSRAGCVEPLTRINFKGELEPLLATEWKQVEPTVWEFKLRQGVKFQNGEPLNAAAVAGALDRLIKADAPPRAFSPQAIASVEAVGEDTVKITTPAPSVLVPLRVAAPATGILAPSAFKDGKIDVKGACTGPFEVTEEVPQESIKLKANAEYWGGKVALDSAEVRFIIDGGVRATLIRTGEAQIAAAIPVVVREQIKAVDNVKLLTRDLPRTTSLYLNNKRAPFDNVKIRQAVQAAIDGSAIASSLFEGAAQAAIGPFAPSEPWAPSDRKAVTPDLEKAKALLAEAGVQPGSLNLTIMAYNERPELPDLATIIQAQLGQIGINVTVRAADYNSLEPDMLGGTYDMALMSRSHLTDVADPAGFLEADYTCKGGFNISQMCDPAFDAEVQKAVGEADQAKRFEIYKALATRLQEDANSVFIVHEQGAQAISTKVKNYEIHPLDHVMLDKNVDMDK